MYRYRPGRANCGVLPLGTRLCVLHNRPWVVYAHLRVSKHSPYVLKFPIQSTTSSLHFKKHCAWGDDWDVIGQQYTYLISLRLVWRQAGYRLAIYNSKSLRCILLTIDYMLSIWIFNITTLSSYMSAVILPTINIPGRKSYEVRSFQYKNISRVNHQHINVIIYTAFS